MSNQSEYAYHIEGCQPIVGEIRCLVVKNFVTKAMVSALLGALLNRFEKVSVPVVGGCKIGTRSVDYHLGAIEQFGGRVEETDGGYIASRERPLKGTHIKLPYPSVGATETCLFAGVLAEGRTIISNAAI